LFFTERNLIMSLKSLIALIIVSAGWLIYSYVRSLMIRNSPVPQAVLDFPVYETTEEEYNAFKTEVEPFLHAALEGRRYELSLTTKQLNCLSARGVTPIKGETSWFPSYYEIDENKLVEKGMTYPCIDSFAGYLITIRVTEFAGAMCFTELIAVNGSPPPSDSSGTVISHIGNLSILGSIFALSGLNSKGIELLAKKITIVEIVDDRLILKI